MKELIKELEKLINLFNDPKTVFINSYYASAKEAVEDIDLIISALLSNDIKIIDRISFLFSPNGDIQKIAADSGWENDFLALAENVDEFIGIIRCKQKRDVTLFSNIKDGIYTDDATYASCPGKLILSKNKWKDIKEIYKLGFFKKLSLNSKKAMIKEYICYGDTQPAMVLSVNPLLIAAYSDEMDAVVILQFPQVFVEKYNLKKYDKLITVNIYWRGTKINHDIFVGKNFLKRYVNFTPSIGDFLSDETEKIEQHKNSIPNNLWRYVRALGEDYLKNHKELIRNGFWFLS